MYCDTCEKRVNSKNSRLVIDDCVGDSRLCLECYEAGIGDGLVFPLEN